MKNLFGEEYRQFVRDYAAEDPNRLRLRFHGDPRGWIPYAINNIEALRHKRKFVTGGEDFTPAVMPLTVSAQQSSSATVAALHASLAAGAQWVMDMTFGLGMDARMMARREGVKLLGFEMQRVLVEAGRINFADLQDVSVHEGDSVEFLKHYDGAPFDLVFIDPARRGEGGRRLFNLHDCAPDLIGLLPLFPGRAKQVMAKLSPMLDVTQTIRDLPGISELHIVEEGGECKELLTMLDFSRGDSPLPYCDVPVTVDRHINGRWESMTFTLNEEAAASPRYLNRLPVAGEYLFEPSAAVMKGGCFNLLCHRYGLKKLHPNTHLYVLPSDAEICLLPGKVYRVEEAMGLQASKLKQIGQRICRADIAIRNLPSFTPDTLRKRLKIGAGGSHKLFGTTILDNQKDTPSLLLTTTE